MSYFRDNVIAAIKSAADTAGGFLKAALGTTGNFIEFPSVSGDDEYLPEETIPTGQAWGGSGMDTFTEMLLHGTGLEVDKFSISWAKVSTNATGVAPTYTESYGFDTGTAISKNETSETITLTFDTAYASAHYVVYGYVDSTESSFHVHTYATGSVEIHFHNIPSGVSVDINNQTAYVLVIGKR